MSFLRDKLRREAGRRPAADPVLAAIENHRRAHLRLDRACHATDDAEAKRESRVVTHADELELDRALTAEEKALRRLEAILPTTPAGARALVQYIRYRSGAWDEASTAILLTNVMHSAPLSGALADRRKA
jgi:hypothetical protein